MLLDPAGTAHLAKLLLIRARNDRELELPLVPCKKLQRALDRNGLDHLLFDDLGIPARQGRDLVLGRRPA